MPVNLLSAGGGTTTLTTASSASNFTVTLPSATGTAMVSGNMPTFSVYCSTAQSIANNTATKIQLNTELFDTNSNFDNATNYRFTPTVTGYYQVCGGIYYSFPSGVAQALIYKNGALVFTSVAPASANGFLVPVSGLVYMNGSTDYLELYSQQSSGSSQNLIASRQDLNYFFGSMVRTA